jgi:hypothetical protein
MKIIEGTENAMVDDDVGTLAVGERCWLGGNMKDVGKMC